MRISILAALTAALLANVSLAKLPPLTDEAKAKAAEAAAKSCLDRQGRPVPAVQGDGSDRGRVPLESGSRRRVGIGIGMPAAEATPPCVDPGPYVAQAPVAAKPLEASEAHSPTEMATSPPSSKATSAEITGPRK